MYRLVPIYNRNLRRFLFLKLLFCVHKEFYILLLRLMLIFCMCVNHEQGKLKGNKIE